MFLGICNKKMKSALFLVVFVFAQINFAQGISEAEIRQFFDFYSNSPTKLVEMMVEDFKFKDPTMKLEFGTKADVVKAFSAPSGVTNFKAEPVSIHFISPLVVDVHGINSGKMRGNPFKTLFSTILIFNENKKLISWTDHVDPNTFKGNSSVNDKNRRFVKDFFKFYAKLNSNGIEKYVDENIRLVDPTLGLDFKGISTIREVWKQASEAYLGGKFEIKRMYFITEDVIDTHGFIRAKTKKGKKLKISFSTIFILENGKIKHWVDHVDQGAF